MKTGFRIFPEADFHFQSMPIILLRQTRALPVFYSHIDALRLRLISVRKQFFPFGLINTVIFHPVALDHISFLGFGHRLLLIFVCHVGLVGSSIFY